MIFKKIFLTLSCVIFCVGCSKNASETRPRVIVSVPPYVYFVHELAGELVDVETAMPPGADPHIFEATPRQVTLLKGAQLWIGIGEPYEKKLVESLQENNPDMEILDLSKKIPLLDLPTDSHSHHDEEKDRHFWLSPKSAEQQVSIIAASLKKLLPGQAQTIQNNSSQLIERLEKLNAATEEALEPYIGKAILVSHPSFGYYCYDFGLEQVSVESHGKSTDIANLNKILNLMETLGIKCVITQPQFDNRGAIMIAKQFGLTPYSVDPLAEDYFANINHLTEVIVKSYRE